MYSFACEQYGAPAYFATELTVRHGKAAAAAAAGGAGVPRVQATVWCVNKMATRLPETMFIGFLPRAGATATGAAAGAGAGTWEMQKLGQWQPTTGDVVAGGSKHLHGVSGAGYGSGAGGGGGGVRFNRTASTAFAATTVSLTIEPVDAPVVCLGEPIGFPVPCADTFKTLGVSPWDVEPDVAKFGVSSVLWNNLW